MVVTKIFCFALVGIMGKLNSWLYCTSKTIQHIFYFASFNSFLLYEVIILDPTYVSTYLQRKIFTEQAYEIHQPASAFFLLLI